MDQVIETELRMEALRLKNDPNVTKTTVKLWHRKLLIKAFSLRAHVDEVQRVVDEVWP